MNTKGNDIAAIIGKGLLGAIPIVGPLAAEIVGNVIPNQRIDRIESLLRTLEAKIAKEDTLKFEENIFESTSVDLIEDSFVQACGESLLLRKLILGIQAQVRSKSLTGLIKICDALIRPASTYKNPRGVFI